jgi:aspartyl/asparaginyl beta-hydroxylase (cupin superfamily)
MIATTTKTITMLMKMTKTIKMTLAMMVMIMTTMIWKTMMIHSYNLNHPSKQNSCLKNTDILLYIDTDVTFS